jgi:hypothetical protein
LETVEAASSALLAALVAFAPSFSFILIGAERFDRLRLVRLPAESKRLWAERRALAPDDLRAWRAALAARLLLRKAVTPAPTGRVTAWATKQSYRCGCPRRRKGRAAGRSLRLLLLDERSDLGVCRVGRSSLLS